MASGICNLLKPPGMTSRQAVTRVARLTGEKAGHAGTLDPQACGVLPILLGKATRLFDFVASEHKQYLAEICFGVATDTLDAAGSVVASGGRVPSLQEVLDVLPSFLGSSLQTPPAYSARKVDGVRAYKLAREGAAPVLAPHRICIDALTHVAQTDYNRHLIRIVCSKGTYIRTLCQDIGQALHTHAHMSFLLREQTGDFDIADAVTLEELEKLITNDAPIARWLTPVAQVLQHVPSVHVPAAWVKACLNGMPLPVSALEEPLVIGDEVQVICDNALLGLGWVQDGYIRIKTWLLDKEDT